MAVKKAKIEQAAKAPETSAQESNVEDNPEIVEDTGAEPGAENEKDAEPDPGTEDVENAAQGAETGEDAGEKPTPKVLTALRPILYLARQYKVGESLPANDAEMVEAWIAAGSAEWREKKARQLFH